MSENYDVVIIGAGIGGLTCGCYLAQAGYKVLIAEKHSKPGGYCTSFKRKGFTFDVGIHYLGGARRGMLSGILRELKIEESLVLGQFDPTDKIIMPDTVTYIRADPKDTIMEFQKTFPNEKHSIKDFFQFVMQSNVLTIYAKVRKLTMGEVLRSYFQDQRLINTIGMLFLGNMGLPHTEVAAFAAIILLREFVLDPGYYPAGGMDKFAVHLSDHFKSHAGEIIFSKKVVKITTENNIARGIIIAPDNEITSKIVVSNIDAAQTFNNLIDAETEESARLRHLVPSNSIFAVYLGMKSSARDILSGCSNIWYFSTYDIDGCYRLLSKNISENRIPGIMLSFPSLRDHNMKRDKDTVQLFTMASYESKQFWDENRECFSEKMLSLAEKVIPGLKQYVDLVITATPETFYKFTLNKQGAAYGWASTVNQIEVSVLPQKTSVRNLLLAGHWSTMGGGQGGVSTVALSGKRAAEIIMKRLN